ncbi:MAG: MBL fold metallo-hydrolase [Bacteroidales bacterium]|nr:MBL fold metallo-hydrolase [Bacteroidales bacterium]
MELTFKWVGGATFILTIGNLKIAVDPVLCEKGTVQDFFWFKSKRIQHPVYTEKDLANVDLWLITHNHKDHLDSIGLSKIEKSSKIISNKNAFKILQKSGKLNAIVLDWNQIKEHHLKDYKINVEAIPAIHGINPVSALFAGKVNGYLLTISKGEDKVRIYVTGDTVYKSKVIKALENKEIDLVIPNMGAAKQGSWIMTLTLNSKMLKKMISRLNPKIVIPVHYETFEHYIESLAHIKAINDDRIKIVEVGSITNFNI